jgi:FAD/FMN-containing dehydrogenase
MLSAEVVLANSTVVNASTTSNPDLFWSLRGAGAAFGIVTNFKFKTFTPPESNIVFQYNVSPQNAAQLATMITALQDFSRNTQPPEMNMRLFLASFPTLSGVYYGSRADFDKVMAPLVKAAGITSNVQISTNTWINTLSSFAYGPLPQATPYDTHETFFSKSLMPENLTSTAITAFSNYWQANARSNSRAWYIMFDLHGGNNAAITKVDPDSTAYAHRNAVFKMQFYDRTYNGAYDPNWMSFLNGWMKTITDAMPTQKFGMYINYADTSLTKDQAHQSYWIGKYEKLAALKKVWDPKGTFEGPQLVGS